MSGYAAVFDPSGLKAGTRLSARVNDYLFNASLVDLGCATVGVLAAAGLRLGSNLAPPCGARPAEAGANPEPSLGDQA